MIFNSLSFIFMCFIPCILLVLLVEKLFLNYRIETQNIILVVFSLGFFAWSGLQHVVVLLGLILGNYVIGRIKKYNKKLLLLGVIFNIGVLVYFKYTNLIIMTIDEILHQSHNTIEILAPLGISFIIFQCISYLLDIYFDKANPCCDLLSFTLYIVFFPKLSQGPIVKYRDMCGEIQNRNIRFNEFVQGCERFIVGLSKKVLVADLLASTVSSIFSFTNVGMDVGTAWLGMFCFTVQLYMDFSGYSDMAIGMAKMFGFHFQENFNFPYLSLSITEFWRRWHISLGAWFREYLYFPLGGSRKGNVYINLFIYCFFGYRYMAWGSMGISILGSDAWSVHDNREICY